MFTIADLTALANSEVLFAVLFIGSAWLMVKYFQKTLTDNQTQEVEREAYIMKMHKEREDDYKVMLREQREDSSKREGHLITNLTALTEKQGEISDTLKKLHDSMNKLEGKMESNFTEVWKELSRKA